MTAIEIEHRYETDTLHCFAVRLGAALVAFSACGGAGDATSEGESVGGMSAKDELLSVTLTIGGGLCCPECGDCCECNTVRRGVVAPGELLLEDMASPGMPSQERFELNPSDYSAVVKLVTSPAFQAAIDDTQDCPTVFESSTVIELTWKQRGLLVDNAAAGCVRGGRGTGTHPYTQLYWKLIDLQLQFLECPPHPAGRVSPLRPLCTGCFAWSENPC